MWAVTSQGHVGRRDQLRTSIEPRLFSPQTESSGEAAGETSYRSPLPCRNCRAETRDGRMCV